MNRIDKNMALEDLDFSVRTWKVLKDAGVRTLGDLLDKTPSDLFKFRTMGRTSMKEISDKLQGFGVDVAGFDGFLKPSVVVDEPKSFKEGCHWAEIRNDFFEGEHEINPVVDGDILAKISVDAWKSVDENEDGCVIACVMLSKHGDVLVDYRDNLARYDEMAQGAITEAKAQLKEYFKERNCSLEMENGEWTRDNEGVPEFANSGTVKKDAGEASKEVYCLCEEYEDDDAIREFSILAVSADKDALRKLMESKILDDEYGMIENNGVGTHDEDHFLTEFDCGFVEYYIKSEQVLSREEIERKVHYFLDSKHISEVVKGDRVPVEDCVYTATSDAYMVDTAWGREWKVDIDGPGDEDSILEGYFASGMVEVVSENRHDSLENKIKNAQELVVGNSCRQNKNIEIEK